MIASRRSMLEWPFRRMLTARFGSITALDEVTAKQSQT